MGSEFNLFVDSCRVLYFRAKYQYNVYSVLLALKYCNKKIIINSLVVSIKYKVTRSGDKYYFINRFYIIFAKIFYIKEYSGEQYSGSFIVCIKRLIESILVLISQLDSPLNCIVFP